MKITVSGTMVHLQGEWTLSGLTNVTINSLTGPLQQMKPERSHTLFIDCREVTAIDSIGLMILDGLMYLPRIRRAGAKLVSLPDNLRSSFQNSGFKFCHTINDLTGAQLK